MAEFDNPNIVETQVWNSFHWRNVCIRKQRLASFSPLNFTSVFLSAFSLIRDVSFTPYKILFPLGARLFP